ncbi:cell adhesion molecule DSCAM-like [Acropora muricata]|uniref:cell adhesion molecule DSCAM-like n=1 Tax=Acropora muricata TaxID=159855 RepID=UPI0034E43EAE
MTLMYISIMTAFFGTEVKLIVLLSALSLSYGGFAIQPPYPDNQHVIEHTSVAVTCVAYDTDGVKKPERIDFVKRTDDPVTMLQNTIVLKDGGTIYFTNRTEDNGKKLFVTLHIQNVTKEYDSQLTQFLCKGYAAGVHDQGMAFRINVIKRKEIPKIETTKNAILQRGDETTISCRVTANGSSNAKPKYMAWFKDGELLHSMPVYQLLSSKLKFKSIVVNTDQVRNAGNYTCVLAVKLYNVLDHNESDSTVVTFLPWFETKKNVAAGIVGKKVNLKCSARGYPLDVEWRVTKKIAEDKKVTSCINASADNRFEISRKGVYDPYVLSIVNLNSTDDGDYYCCLASKCSSNIEGICERIRLFVIGNFRIHPPYPHNQYVFEYTSVAVTCAAYGSNGIQKPERIDFVKQTDDPVTMLRNTIVLKEDGTIYFTNRTEDNGYKLFVTLHIQNVTREYDSQFTTFLCKGYPAGVHYQGRAFRITVIKRKEIPKIETTKNAILRRGDETTISCRVTAEGGSNVEPKYMAWFKDGELLHSMPVNQLSSKLKLKSIVVNTDQVRNAGNYTCVLAVKLYNVLDHNESDSTVVTFLPWFETKKNEEAGILGKKIELKCSARGYPLDVEWRVTKKIAEDKTVTSCINASADSRFEISRKGVYDPYVLSIVNLNSTDDGDYYCCLASNCSSNIEGICESIRLFVIDPLSGASMDLSLPCLMLTLFILAASLLNF